MYFECEGDFVGMFTGVEVLLEVFVLGDFLRSTSS
jgi:hypothetical protein